MINICDPTDESLVLFVFLMSLGERHKAKIHLKNVCYYLLMFKLKDQRFRKPAHVHVQIQKHLQCLLKPQRSTLPPVFRVKPSLSRLSCTCVQLSRCRFIISYKLSEWSSVVNMNSVKRYALNNRHTG